MMWYSDDHGKTYHPSLDASGRGNPAQIMGQDEIALAETPDGGVIASMRNVDCEPPASLKPPCCPKSNQEKHPAAGFSPRLTFHPTFRCAPPQSQTTRGTLAT